MKKIIFFMFVICLFSFPIFVNASSYQEYPPYINFQDEENYDIEKIIGENTVTVRLKRKTEKTYYSWTFDKDKIGDTIDIDFEIDLDNDVKEIKDLVGDVEEIKYLTFKHHGTLPSSAKMTIYVGDRFTDKDKLYLYYYNEETKKIEAIDKNIKVSQGYIEFSIDHCSKYFLTKQEVEIKTVMTAKEKGKSINYIITGLIIAVIGISAATLFSKV